MIRILLFIIKAYQLAIAPFIGDVCRFYPTCSNYSCEAFIKHGVLKGFWLTLKRILRCHPWHPGGCDPVP